MPQLARFFGVIARMFAEVDGAHRRPHFRAYNQDDVGIFGIEPVELLAGTLPSRQRRLVEAWAELHGGGDAKRFGSLAGRREAGADRAPPLRVSP